MSSRFSVLISVWAIVGCCVAATALGGPGTVALEQSGDIGSIRGDLTAAGLPGVRDASVEWRDYDQDGDRDFVLLSQKGATWAARVYRNDGGGLFKAVASCATSGDSTICEGDLSAGVALSGTSSIDLWVRNLTTNIAPGTGTAGIKVTRNAGAAGQKGPSIDVHFVGGTHAVITQGDGAHGVVGTSRGGNGATGGDDYSGFNPFYPVSNGGAGRAGGAGGDITFFLDGPITTEGVGSHGIFALSEGATGGRGGHAGAIAYAKGGNGGSGGEGGNVDIENQGSVTTEGDGSHGILAISQGGNGGHGGDAGATVAEGGNGGGGGVGGQVLVRNHGEIETAGDESHGILAQSLGGIGGSGGVGGGLYGGGGGASPSGAGGTASVVNTGSVLTEGVGSNGIMVQSIGGFGARGGASGGLVSFGGLGATGGNGGAASIQNSGSITTLGPGANALLAESIGGGGGSGAGSGGLVSLGGSGSAGGHGGSVVIANSGRLEVQGPFSNGILAQSIGGGGGNGAGSGGLVSIGGAGSSTGHGGVVTVENSGTVLVMGNQAHAILAQSIGGGGGFGAGSGGMVAIGGSGNSGGNGGAVAVTNTGALRTEGVTSAAILAQSVGGGGGNGGGSGGIAAFGGSGSVTSHGGRVSVVNSGSIETGSESLDLSLNGSQAIFAQSVGGGGGNGGTSGGWFSMGGSGGGGGNGGIVRVENTGALRTQNDNSSAIFAQSVGGGGGNGGGSIAGQAPIPAVAIGGSGAGGGHADSVSVHSDAAVTTSGDGSHGILAQSVGGGGGNGGFAVTGAAVLSPVKVGIGGSAAAGGNGGAVDVLGGGTIATAGADAHGIVAQSVGGGGGTGGFSVAASLGGGVNWNIGIGGAGGLGGDGSIVRVGTASDPLGGSISTTGERSYGILAQSIGGGGGNGGFVVTGALLGGTTVNLGFGGKGGSGGRGEAVHVVSTADIATGGEAAHGIVAQSIGGGGGAGGWTLAAGVTAFGGTSLTLGGGGGPGAKAGLVEVANGGTIVTEGDFSHGILAQSIGGGGGNGGMSGSAMLNFSSLIPMPPQIPVTVGANFGIGIGGAGGSGAVADSVRVENNGQIVTGGEFSHGIVAQSVGGGGGAGGKSVAATANIGGLPTGEPNADIKVDFALAIGGSGGSGNHGGVVDVGNTGRIDTQGDGSHGILAQSIGGGGGLGGNARAMTVGIDPAQWLGITDPLQISVSANVAVGGKGGSAGNGSLVNLENAGDITTRGDDAHGILAQSIGGGGGAGGGGYHGLDLADLGVPDEKIPDYIESGLDLLNDSKVQVVVGGQGGSSGHGGTVDIANTGAVRTLGDGSFGILAQSIGGGGGIGGVGAQGDGTVGVGGRGGSAGNGGAVAIQSSGSIETNGVAAHAIVAQSIGGGGGIAGNIDRGIQDMGLNLGFGQNGGSAGNGGAVLVDADGNIVTRGNGSGGIVAQSIGGGGGIGGDIGFGLGFAGSVGGDGSGGAVDVRLNGSITTYGDVSHGIFAQSAGGRNDLLPGDHGDLGSAVRVEVDGDVLTYGRDSHGIVAQSLGDDGSGDITVDIESGTVQGGTGTGAGVLFLDGADNALTNRGTVRTLGGLEGLAIRGTTGSEAIENYGLVIGSVNLGGGFNSFHNAEGARFEAGSLVDLGEDGSLTNEGVLAPGGSSVATTTLNGDFTQTGAGTYEVTVCGKELDKLVVSGDAALDGTLEVVADAEAYLDGQTYDIIEAAGVDGTFSDVVLPETAFLDFDMEYVGGDGVRLTVDVTPFASVAGNQMERAVGSVLDACATHATGDISRVIGQFQLASAGQVAEGFYSLGPASYDNLTRGALQSTRLHQDDLEHRMDASRSRPTSEWLASTGRSYQGERGWWLSGLYQGGNQEEAGGFVEHSFSTTGTQAGYERAEGRTILGASLGIMGTDVENADDQADGTATGYMGSLYGGALWGRTYAQSVLTFAWNDFDNRRDIHVGTEEREAKSTYSGNTFSALLTGGTRMPVGSWGLEPFGAVRYQHLAQDGFQESGAGSVNLIVEDRSVDWVGSDLGFRFTTNIMNERSAFLPEFRVAWNHNFGVSDREVEAAFEGDPTMPFTIAGEDVDRDAVTAGLGLTYQTVGGWKATLRYDRLQGSDFDANSVAIRLGSGF